MDKICPLITKLIEQDRTTDFLTFKLLRQPCLKEECVLWIKKLEYDYPDSPHTVVEGDSHCGLLRGENV